MIQLLIAWTLGFFAGFLTAVVLFARHSGAGAGRPRLNATVGPVSLKEANPVATTIQITNREQIDLSFTPDAPIDGVVELIIESGPSTFLTVSDNHFKLVSTDLGTPQITTYKARADIDRGTEIETLEETYILVTDDPKATSLGGTVGMAEPKP